jgi:hypothetical protein
MVKAGSQAGFKNVNFAIADHANSVRPTIDNKMPGISSVHRQIVEDVNTVCLAQAVNHLVKMQTLNNHSKHRTLQLAAKLPVNATVQAAFVDCIGAGHTKPVGGADLVAGTEIARFPITPTGPNPMMTTQGAVTVELTIDRMLVGALLNAVADTVRVGVLEKVQPSSPPEALALVTTPLSQTV